MTKLQDLTGKRFGRLVVVERDASYQKKSTKWVCKCDCGRVVSVFASNLVRGTSTSCGCYKRDNPSRTTHGMSGTRLYGIWTNMKTRCENPRSKYYDRYGGRGITVCEEWQNPERFFEWAKQSGYGDDMTIERVDNDLGYSPENCRWATMKEQENNRSNSRLFTMDGKTQTLALWCDEYGQSYKTVYKRIFVLGWDFEKAITSPIDTSKRNNLTTTKEVSRG